MYLIKFYKTLMISLLHENEMRCKLVHVCTRVCSSAELLRTLSRLNSNRVGCQLKRQAC